MRNLMLAAFAVILYVLHQDVWLWDDARPLMFGVLPIGLTYHVLYSIVIAGFMWLLVRVAWPSHLEDER
jgi:hypothetical protein